MSARDNSIFVPRVSELCINGRIYEPGIIKNHPRVQRDTPAPRASPPDWRHGGIYDPGIGSYHLRVALALRAPANQRSADRPVGLGFAYRAGVVDRGELDFRPQSVGVVEIWTDV